MIFENAKWIWSNPDYKENEYCEFLEKIDFSGERVIFRISANGDYTLFINGKYVESNQYGDFPHYKVYDEIDITDYLKKGENTILFRLTRANEDAKYNLFLSDGPSCTAHFTCFGAVNPDKF